MRAGSSLLAGPAASIITLCAPPSIGPHAVKSRVKQSELATPRSRLRRLAVDLTPLRTSRDFRLLWFGELISTTGSQIALVAVFVQVYDLTGSAAAVGLVGLVQLVPLALAALVGGPLIDLHDRRRLLLVAQCGEAVAAGVLFAGAAAGHPPLAVVYGGAALVAGCSGFSLSVRSSMTPNLVPREQLSSALSLNQVMWNTCLIAGPALGGIVIDELGLTLAYGLDVVSFAATILACLLMRPQYPSRSLAGRETRPAPFGTLTATLARGWREMTEGFRFLRGRRVIQATFYVDLVAMIFGMPRALFPVLAVTQFDAGPQIVGVLFSAVSVGALLGALTTGWVRHVRRQASQCSARSRCGAWASLPSGSWATGFGSRWYVSRSPGRPTSSRPCSAGRSSSKRCPTRCADACRRCTSSSSSAARAWETWRQGRSPPCSRRRSR